MSAKKFHLGWFLNFTADLWNSPFETGGMPWTGGFYVDIAQMLERACFDYVMVEDKLSVSEAYGGSSEMVLKHAVGMVPKHDPAPLAALMAAGTTKLGVVITMSTLGYPPFLLARLASTLDHIAGGRFGWNVVTSAEDAAAQNFGLDQLPPRELRYDMAHEYMELCYKLWDSWEPDAIVRDREKGVYADYKKVRPVHFHGRFFKSRGPLNTAPMPQGRPTIVQAGGSPKGRDFASKHADSIITLADGLEGMKEYRDDIRARARKHGRNPDDIKVLFLVIPTLAETREAAYERREKLTKSTPFVEQTLSLISAITDIDFAKFPLDEPLPHLTTNGEQGSLDKFQQASGGKASGKTLRQLIYESAEFESSIELLGTPESVADDMGRIMEEIGGDGFLITMHNQAVSRRNVLEVTEGLVPALQRRGLVRTEYTGRTLRDNLRAF
jgi:FMN-dependent oxidoreductase (nitrilotriacetate monooxygenase family)